ncbi:MAG TPA: helix-turn-helix domain-containing protein [Candidatus Eubacterium faecavium]|nr:helix-turn-helix domain-containing protein [Candidatus Eubacterium faecavium]
MYQRVRDYREDHEYTQEEIAEQLGLYVTQYRRYETGETEIPVHILIKLKELYKTTLDDLTEIVIEK